MKRLIARHRHTIGEFIKFALVGLLNTALVSVLGIILATILGVIVGVARLSKNILVQGLARAYIEALRNIPLLVMLIFWYSGLFLKLPRVNQATPGPGGGAALVGPRVGGVLRASFGIAAAAAATVSSAGVKVQLGTRAFPF